jgi:ubiquinone/menaquinone biosynthesis C-methylase UbiE
MPILLSLSETYRRLYQSRLFTRFYGRLAGKASVAFFSEHLQSHLLQFLPTGARVLEVGSGPGLQAIDLARRRPDIELVASDFSSAFVRLGAENLAAALSQPGTTLPPHPSVSFVQADAMNLAQFPGSSFDAVYSITAIKHFPDPVQGVRECVRVLRVGGRLLLSEFDRDCALLDLLNLARLMRVPAPVRLVMARVIRAGVRREAPALADVRQWLSAAGIAEDHYQLGVVESWPVWLAVIRKAK